MIQTELPGEHHGFTWEHPGSPGNTIGQTTVVSLPFTTAFQNRLGVVYLEKLR